MQDFLLFSPFIVHFLERFIRGMSVNYDITSQ